jgi:hypothetical protein
LGQEDGPLNLTNFLETGISRSVMIRNIYDDRQQLTSYAIITKQTDEKIFTIAAPQSRIYEVGGLGPMMEICVKGDDRFSWMNASSEAPHISATKSVPWVLRNPGLLHHQMLEMTESGHPNPLERKRLQLSVCCSHVQHSASHG